MRLLTCYIYIEEIKEVYRCTLSEVRVCGAEEVGHSFTSLNQVLLAAKPDLGPRY